MKISQAEVSFTVHHAPDTLSQSELRRIMKRRKHTRKGLKNCRVLSHIPRRMQIGLVEWACQITGQCNPAVCKYMFHSVDMISERTSSVPHIPFLFATKK